jgi:uncharacterized repeat protein (TIGR03803 family)
MRASHLLYLIIHAAGLAAPQISSGAGQPRFATLYTFTSDNPAGITAAGGAFYGATQGPAGNGTNCGTAFELQPPATGGAPWTESVISEFGGPLANPCDPQTAPVTGPGGGLYGTTVNNGAYNAGTLYELTPPLSPGGTWAQTVVFSFGPLGGDGIYPFGTLIPGPGGSFYVLAGGGANGNGALVQLTPPTTAGGAWSGANLYSFPVDTVPNSLVLGPNGVFYGTGAEIFQLTPPAAPGGVWTYTALYDGRPFLSFSPTSLIVASDGTIYGSSGSWAGFLSGGGAVFQLTPPAVPGGSWTFAVLHGFATSLAVSPLVLHHGNLYGTLAGSQSGGVFKLHAPSTPGGSWALTYLHQFAGGEIPYAPLVIRGGGTLYGVSRAGAGDPLGGTVYAITLQ